MSKISSRWMKLSSTRAKLSSARKKKLTSLRKKLSSPRSWRRSGISSFYARLTTYPLKPASSMMY
jgi:hypothetical protein